MDFGKNPTRNLHDAAFEGDLETIVKLLDLGADVNAIDSATSSTPLLRAIENLQDETVRLLLARGADPNHPGYMGITPLQAAVDAAVEESKWRFDSIGESVPPATKTIELLLAAGANPLRLDANGKSATDWARTNHPEAARLMKGHLCKPHA